MTQAAWQDDLGSPAVTQPAREANPERTGVVAAIAKAAPYAVLVLAVAFLCFVAGSFVTFKGVFPAKPLTDAFRGGLALLDKETQYNSPFPQELWQPARTDAKGVTVYDPARADNGLTLYSSGDGQKVRLISMTGELVHEWYLPYSAVWDDSAAVRHPQPDSQIYVEKAQLLPNGDLVAIYVAVGDSPWGYGMVKIDKDSKVLWKYLKQTHHDFDIAADGKIYALTHEIRTDVVAGQEHLAPPRIDDYAVELSPDGEELKKVWLLGALATSRYATFLSTVPWYIAKGKGDYLHTNSIDVISPDLARRLPAAAAADEVLLSFREIGTLALLDLDRQEIVWALRGPWLRQHDAEALPDGHMMVFDNEGQGGDASRVLEFDPSTLQITWSYAGDPEHAFFSRVRSAEQRLPNGNTLITESDGGRLLEVTPAGEIVWEYLNPVRGGEAGELIPIVSWGQRIDPAGLDPSFRELVTD
jgi:outer membrane protein assembly factor BamB